jgi:hypothetical protein
VPADKRDKPVDPTEVGLPATPFLFTLDQIAVFLNVSEGDLVHRFIWFSGGTIGRKSPRQIKAVNIQPDPNRTVDWRVSQGEFIRWCKLIGLKVYSQGRVV